MNWIDKVHSVDGFTVDDYDRHNENITCTIIREEPVFVVFETCINTDEMYAEVSVFGYESSVIIETVEAACTYLDALGVEFRKGDTP